MTDEVPVLAPSMRHWACPACPQRLTKPGTVNEQEYHACPGTGGLTVPLVEVSGPGVAPDARHVPQLGPNGALTSVGTEHGPNSVHPGRVDRTVFLGPPAAAS